MKNTPLAQQLADVLSAREVIYGAPEEIFGDIAERWSSTLKIPIRADQVLLCMMDLKLARLAKNPSHKDSLLDIMGYATCYGRVWG